MKVYLKRDRYWLLAMVLIVSGIVFCNSHPAFLDDAFRARVAKEQEKSNRIREGMTQPEVEGILGGPEGDHSTDPECEPGFGPLRSDLNNLKKWRTNYGTTT